MVAPAGEWNSYLTVDFHEPLFSESGCVHEGESLFRGLLMYDLLVTASYTRQRPICIFLESQTLHDLCLGFQVTWARDFGQLHLVPQQKDLEDISLQLGAQRHVLQAWGSF